MKKSQDYLLNSKIEAQKIIARLKREIIKLKVKPGLAAILIGSDPASQVYVNIKEKRAGEIGVNFKKYLLPAAISENKVIELIKKLNKNKKIHGILLQLPLPSKFNTKKIIATILPDKDVDGLLFGYQKTNIPPTLQSILHLIKLSGQKLKGKQAIILANSPEFAGPLQNLLIKKGLKVDVKLKPKKNIRLLDYQIIIIALGQKYFLKPAMIKKNTVIIDVGISRSNKKIFGDVHPNCFKKSPYISPVPGGVGPLTVAFLFKNLLKLVQKK